MPITIMVKVPEAVVAIPSLGVKTLPELIAKAKANPGKINFALRPVRAVCPTSGRRIVEARPGSTSCMRPSGCCAGGERHARRTCRNDVRRFAGCCPKSKLES